MVFTLSGKKISDFLPVLTFIRRKIGTVPHIFPKIKVIGQKLPAYRKIRFFCFFQKAEPETEEEEDEVVMFLLKGEGDEQELLPLEDETLMDEVFAEFCNQYEQYEDSDDAMKLDGADD